MKRTLQKVVATVLTVITCLLIWGAILTILDHKRATSGQIDGKAEPINFIRELSEKETQETYLFTRLNGQTRVYHTFKAIAQAESRFSQSAVNKRTGDYGLFQVNARTWDKEAKKRNLDYKHDFRDNIELALIIRDQQGYSAWNASRGKWLHAYQAQAKVGYKVLPK